jgi:hypothetical protein
MLRNPSVTSWGYIVIDDKDSPVLLRRGIWVDGEILNMLLGGTPESMTVSSWIRFLLGGHIVVGDEIALLLLFLEHSALLINPHHYKVLPG